jgi:preprotein translocase subunit YajC
MIASSELQAPLVVAMSAQANPDAPVWVQLMPFVMIGAIFYFLILMPMKRRQRKVDEFQRALKVGDRIVTTGGIYGQITKLSDRSVQLQVADKVRIEVARAAVGGYQGQDPVVEPPTAS